MDDIATGTCSVCGRQIQSATSKMCIDCFRKTTRPCPHCRRFGRAVRREYLSYIDRHGNKVIGKLCPVCNGERFVTRERR